MMRAVRAMLAAALLLSLAACSSAVSSPTGETEVIGPIILGGEETTAEVTVGRTVVFNVEDPGAWTLAADPAELVALTPGGEQDGATFNPGAKALAVGDVTVTLSNAATGERLTFSITIR